ncbi:MAG: hypothetical protein MJK14_11835 [Rivularia sp. ALOHA_DT_140]|nr:hypothetical protein [Rivularia sp. ALOHA_DT_140]
MAVLGLPISLLILSQIIQAIEEVTTIIDKQREAKLLIDLGTRNLLITLKQVTINLAS